MAQNGMPFAVIAFDYCTLSITGEAVMSHDASIGPRVGKRMRPKSLTRTTYDSFFCYGHWSSRELQICDFS
jgi:hypothetical protein